jgi:hypothetical protein
MNDSALKEMDAAEASGPWGTAKDGDDARGGDECHGHFRKEPRMRHLWSS